MKKKQIAILLGMTLCRMPLSSCSADAKTDTKQEETKETGEDQENRIFGEVISVKEDSITISEGKEEANGADCLFTAFGQEMKGDLIWDGIVYVEGTSDYTITTESYEDQADLSSASKTTSWSDYEVEKPAEL